jgi:hypothetical protein
VHGPQHAAPPLRDVMPMRAHAQRALRLFIATGTWAAGLCLVVGSVALVAETTGPANETHVATAAGEHPLRPGELTGNQGPAALARTFQGTGNRTTSQFTVAPHRQWELHWSYACPAATPAGHLLIREGGAGNAGVSVSATGRAGAGSTSAYARAAAHYLVVIANCTWTIRVTGSR